MTLFSRERRQDVPELEVDGDEATLTPRQDPVEEPPPPSEPQAGQSRRLKLPKSQWW